MKTVNMRKKLIRQDCKRYRECIAYVCPIDPLWKKVRYTKDDPICILLLCMSKPGGEEIVKDYLPKVKPSRFRDFCENVLARHDDIKLKFERVANTPFWYMEKQLKEDAEWQSQQPKGNKS